MDDLLTEFLVEAREGLAELDLALLKLELAPDDHPTLSLIFRTVHTIKGTCGFLGLPRLEHVAHAAENVLGRLRDGSLVATPPLISLILAAVDRIRLIVDSLGATAAEPPGDDAALIADLDRLAGDEAAAPELLAALFDATPAPAPTPASEPAAAPESLAPEPPDPEPPPISDVAALRRVTGERRGPDRQDAGRREPEAAPPGTPADPPGQTIRVAVEVLEDLMAVVSELVLTRNQLLQLARSQDNAPFAAPLQRLSLITSSLQDGVMKARMQPISNAWNKLPRLVRDLCLEFGKQIDLVMLGAETELDRQVLELVRDPLTHMVRNSGDHGLETPAERRAAGKGDVGRLALTAWHEGGQILIEVADDGRGLAVDRIRAKALANGLATETELAAMSDTQIQRFIFRAGLSTAAAVTSVSGRGVGMDVVKTNIEKIGGTIDLKSTPGAGTVFTIKIPLTLAIVSALIVEAGGERFAIPQTSVLELVRCDIPLGEGRADAGAAVRRGHRPEGDGGLGIEHIDTTPLLRLRDRLLPLISLDVLLGLATPQHVELTDRVVVVAQVGGNLMGLIVDRVFDTEEIVVKPVAPILRHITLFSGNTILGDGAVIMILDPNGIARATGILSSGNEARVARVAAPRSTRSSDRTAMLVFRAGGGALRAVPLSLVARLEDVPRARIESAGNTKVTQFRGRLMPLVPFPPLDETTPSQPVLVFTDGERSMGLMVDRILDVVEDRLEIELATTMPGLLGTAVIGGLATDVIDTGYWLTQAWQDWFVGHPAATQVDAHVLVVDDSPFFRQLLVPFLAAAGYRVTAVDGPEAALALRDSAAPVDVVVSDIEMPGMNGFDLARELRSGGAWAGLPLIALTSLNNRAQAERGRAAGFQSFVAKADREGLLATLQQCLATTSRSGPARAAEASPAAVLPH